MKLRTLFLVLGFTASFALPLVLPAQVHAQPAVGAVGARECEKGILTFPVWFRGMGKVEKVESNGTVHCTIASPDEVGGLSTFIWSIVLNVIDIILQLIAYAAVAFLIVGGFQYMTGGGNPASLQKAKGTIANALIGLVISLASVGIVNLIFGFIK